jgi:hypothetical protein
MAMAGWISLLTCEMGDRTGLPPQCRCYDSEFEGMGETWKQRTDDCEPFDICQLRLGKTWEAMLATSQGYNSHKVVQ